MSLNLIYSVREGLLSLRRSRLATLWTLSTITITLTIFGVFLVLTFNIRSMIDKVRQQILLEVFIDNSLPTKDIENLQEEINSRSGVQETTFISKDAALARFKTEWGDDPLEVLDENPLPMSFEIRIAPSQRSENQIQDLVRSIEQLPGVDEVVYRGGIFKLVNTYGRYIYLADGVLLFLVLTSALFLVSNTLRLTILSQHKNIQIMRLVGATRTFIRRPYLVVGLLQGASGGILASVLVWVVFKLIRLRFPVHFIIPAPVIIAPILLGILLSFWGSQISVKRFLTDI